MLIFGNERRNDTILFVVHDASAGVMHWYEGIKIFYVLAGAVRISAENISHVLGPEDFLVVSHTVSLCPKRAISLKCAYRFALSAGCSAHRQTITCLTVTPHAVLPNRSHTLSHCAGSMLIYSGRSIKTVQIIRPMSLAKSMPLSICFPPISHCAMVRAIRNPAVKIPSSFKGYSLISMLIFGAISRFTKSHKPIL